MRPVCVQLDGNSHLPDPAHEGRQISVQARLASGDRHAVEKPRPLFQESEKLFLLHDRFDRTGRQLVIVAVGAPQIAAAQKDCTGHMAGVIQQCHFLQSVYFHKVPPFIRIDFILISPEFCLDFAKDPPQTAARTCMFLTCASEILSFTEYACFSRSPQTARVSPCS